MCTLVLSFKKLLLTILVSLPFRINFRIIVSIFTKNLREILTGHVLNLNVRGFPGGAVVKNPPANAGDTGSSPGPGRAHMLRSN